MNRLNVLLVTFLITSFMANAQLQPILQWTDPLPDLDKPLLGYELVHNTQTSTLYTATPSTGTYSHHSHITFFEGAIYTIWSNHLRD